LCDQLAKRGRCSEHGDIAPLWDAYAIGYADAIGEVLDEDFPHGLLGSEAKRKPARRA
jgi:hypothetical protein